MSDKVLKMAKSIIFAVVLVDIRTMPDKLAAGG
jgi:hypothetical protein